MKKKKKTPRAKDKGTKRTNGKCVPVCLTANIENGFKDLVEMKRLYASCLGDVDCGGTATSAAIRNSFAFSFSRSFLFVPCCCFITLRQYILGSIKKALPLSVNYGRPVILQRILPCKSVCLPRLYGRTLGV